MAFAFTLATTKFLQRSTDILDYNGNYTWMAWILFNQLTTFDTMYCVNDASANNRDMLLLNNTTGNNLTSRVAVAAAQTTQAGSTTLSTGVWYHVTMLRDAQNSLKVYLNGSLEGTNTRSTTGRAAASNMLVGIEQAAGNALNASIAHMKIWSRALTVGEIINESKIMSPHVGTSIYGWWPTLINTARNKDFSGFTRDWTENGVIGDVANPPVAWGADEDVHIYIPASGVNIPVFMHQRLVQGAS